MGRRAKKAPVQTKKRPTLAKRFKCPFCANEDVVECKMDFRAGIGSLSCRLCGATYQMPIHHLHEPVDVFSEWLDDCEAAAQGRDPNAEHAAEQAAAAAAAAPPQYDSDDDDDNIPSSSGLKSNKESGGGGGGKASSGKPKGKSDNKSSSAEAAAPSYTDLGLDDSDDDDSDDE